MRVFFISVGMAAVSVVPGKGSASSSNSNNNNKVLAVRGSSGGIAKELASKVYYSIKSAYETEFPTDSFSFDSLEDVVSQCNGRVMHVDAWPMVAVPPARSTSLKDRLTKLGGAVDVWPVSHPVRGACIRIQWTMGTEADGASDEVFVLTRTNLAVFVVLLLALTVWIKYVPSEWKLARLEDLFPGVLDRLQAAVAWFHQTHA